MDSKEEATDKKKKKIREKWIILTEHHEYIDWEVEKDKAIFKAKKLTKESGQKHLVAKVMFAFECTVVESKDLGN